MILSTHIVVLLRMNCNHLKLTFYVTSSSDENNLVYVVTGGLLEQPGVIPRSLPIDEKIRRAPQTLRLPIK